MKGSRLISLRIPEHFTWALDLVEDIAQLERVSDSKVIREAIKEYVQRHYKGPEGANPQRRLIPDTPTQNNFMLKRRRDLMFSLEETIKANPGARMFALEAKFAAATGLKRKTVHNYMETLVRSGKVEIRWDRVYKREG